MDKLLPELPGILNLAIAGYKRLRKRGHFVQPESAKEAADELIRTDVKAFIEDECWFGPKEEVECGDVYFAYRRYCEANGYKPKDHRQFGRLLRQAVKPHVVTKHRPCDPNSNGKERKPTYHGIMVEFGGRNDDAPGRNARGQ